MADALSQEDLDALMAGFAESAPEEQQVSAQGAEETQRSVEITFDWGEQVPPEPKGEVLSQDEIDRMLAELGR